MGSELSVGGGKSEGSSKEGGGPRSCSTSGREGNYQKQGKKLSILDQETESSDQSEKRTGGRKAGRQLHLLGVKRKARNRRRLGRARPEGFKRNERHFDTKQHGSLATEAASDKKS